jgi:hypothetical protein
MLERFYFDGIPGFRPAIHPDHFSITGGGVRTSEQTSITLGGVRMYQFRTTKQCDGDNCTFRMTPDVLENLPFSPLFDATANLPKGKAFRDAFVSQVQNLAIRDVNLYFMQIPRDFLQVESNALDSEATFAFDVPFSRGRAIPEGVEFRNRIQAELTRIGSTLTPEQIILRAETQDCVGCHFLGAPVGEGVVFPRSIDAIQQVTEDQPETGEFGPNSRFRISSAMTDVFIPHRMKILTDFLTTGKPPEHSQTVGGGRSVQ